MAKKQYFLYLLWFGLLTPWVVRLKKKTKCRNNAVEYDQENLMVSLMVYRYNALKVCISSRIGTGTTFFQISRGGYWWSRDQSKVTDKMIPGCTPGWENREPLWAQPYCKRVQYSEMLFFRYPSLWGWWGQNTGSAVMSISPGAVRARGLVWGSLQWLLSNSKV